MPSKSIETNTGGVREFLTTLFWALFIAMLVRTFLFQPFHIPTGSMEPNLLAGDYVITSKYSVGYGQYAASPIPFPSGEGRLFEKPLNRGEMIVFRPDGLDKNFIKRLVGLPGDEVQMIDGIVHINGQAVQLDRVGQRQHTGAGGRNQVDELWVETFPEGHSHQIYDSVKNNGADNTSIFKIPDGHFFMMGDNRDHSLDSRMPVSDDGAGLVPAENIIGRAEFILLSVREDFSIIRPWTWHRLRGDRFFVGLR